MPFRSQTTRALGRYIRAHRTHRLAGADALWLADRGERVNAGLPPTTRRDRRRQLVCELHPGRGRADHETVPVRDDDADAT